MPELPEMETYRRLLEEVVKGRKVTDVEVNRKKCVNLPADTFCQQIKGWRVSSVERRAKHLLVRLESGKLLMVHLMLGGWMYFGENAGDREEESAQIVLAFENGHLYFFGLRFGYVHLLTNAEVSEKFADLGPEPLSPDFIESDFSSRILKKRGILKNTLVDQHFISGIGNRYSDEICFHARQLPLKRCADLSDEDAVALYDEIPKTLQESIANGGYMSRPFFEGDPFTGGFAKRMKVYNREGEPCERCGQPIAKEKLGSRKVFYCPNCQS